MKNEPTLIELTPRFRSELQKMCDGAGIPHSGRFSVQITVKKPSLIAEVMNRRNHNGK